MLKKRLAILLFLSGLAALVLAACGQSSAPGASNAPTSEPTTDLSGYQTSLPLI